MKRAAPPDRAQTKQDASPQVGAGHGHTQVSNELLEAFARFPFTGPQARLLFFVLRDSYGWKRKETRAYSYTELGGTLNMPRGTMHRAFEDLRDLGILDRGADGGWILIKNYNGWGKGPMLPLGKLSTEKADLSTRQNGTVDNSASHIGVPLVERSTGGTEKRSTGGTKASTGGTERSTSGTPYGERKLKKKERGTDSQLLPNDKTDTPRHRAELGHEDFTPEDHGDFKRLSFKLQDELTETWKERREKARKATSCRKCETRSRASDAWAYCRPCTACDRCGGKADGRRTFTMVRSEIVCNDCNQKKSAANAED